MKQFVFSFLLLYSNNVFSLMLFQGEVCVSSSRILVQEGIYEEIAQKLVEKAKSWVVGDPFDPRAQQGPQVMFFYCTVV